MRIQVSTQHLVADGVMMARVFLSYDRDDTRQATAMATAIESAGHAVWWDRHITSGTQFTKEIEEALSSAEAVVVLWSKNSVESAWVRDEAAVGQEMNRLIPVSIDGTAPPLGFRQLQTIMAKSRLRPAEMREVLEGISKVSGAAVEKPHPKLKSPTTTRRTFTGSILAGCAALAGGYLFVRSKQQSIPAEAQALMEQGWLAQMQGNREGHSQAIALFQRVVAIVPKFASGWAALAMAYRDTAQFRPQSENEQLRERARFAAKQALEIDPENGLAEAMIAASVPHRRGLFQMEHGLRRALERDPKNEALMIVLGSVLLQGGRAREAVEVLTKITTRPLLPVQYYNMAHALWAANRPTELDRLIADAVNLYPAQPTIWFLRLELWGFGEAPARATAFLRDRAQWPTGLPQSEIEFYLATVGAVQNPTATNIDGVLPTWVQRAHQGTVFAEDAIQYASLLGRIDEAFAIADAYYFGRGFRVPDVTVPGANDFAVPDERETALLFEPPTRRMRDDARFGGLLRELGLEDYWQQAGAGPDYRSKAHG